MSASSSSSTQPGHLQTLLSLCKNLHKTNADALGATLSLPLLVPLHQSLCQAVHLNLHPTPQEAPVVTEETLSLSLDARIDKLCTEPSEAALCRNVLRGNDPREQLATLQYLLYQPPYKATPLQGLVQVVLPWLETQTQQQSSSDTDDTLQSIPAASLELLEASLAAVFTSSSHSTEGLRECCLKACQQQDTSSSQLTEWHWTVQGRVLMRLHAWLLEINQSDQAKLVLTILRDKCIQALQTPTHSRQAMVAWLRPMTMDWLPYWREQPPPQSDATEFYPLWECVWKIYHHQQQDEVNESFRLQLLLSTTSVLCSIVPFMVEDPMPVIRVSNIDSHSNTTTAILFHQPCLWDLIHTCLRQGIPRPIGQPSSTDIVAHDKEFTMLRRRGLFLLRAILPTSSPTPEKKIKKKESSLEDDALVLLWKKYVQVMETLEMETEQHLIEQVWATLIDVMDASAQSSSNIDNPLSTPPITWHWTKLLFSRVLTSYDQSMVRKLAIYRFLNGQAGISLQSSSNRNNVDDDNNNNEDTTSKKGKGKKKGNDKKKKNITVVKEGAPLTILTPSFVCNLLVVSFDSLVGSVGTNINMDTEVIDLVPLLTRFLGLYYSSLQEQSQRKGFLSILWHRSFVEQLHTKTLVPVWECLAQTIAGQEDPVEIDSDVLMCLIQAVQHLFNTASVVGAYQESLLGSLATMLCHTRATSMDPKIILQVLSLFDSIIVDAKKTTTLSHQEGISADAPDELDTNPIHASLQRWLTQIGDGGVAWISTVASSVAAAFVTGDLLSAAWQVSGNEAHWEPVSGANKLEREMARSVAYLCTLVGRCSRLSKPDTPVTAGELLWPSIHKGLANVPVAMLGTSWTKADVVTRSLLLLEEGCRLQVLSGMGNGDLIVDGKTQQMMPPPPNIEALLESSSKFILHQTSFLVSVDPNKKDLAGASRSTDAKKASVTFANLISQIQLFHKAYPSSLAISKIVDEMLTTSLDDLQGVVADPESDIVRQTALVYASLSCGASLPTASQLPKVCRLLLQLEFRKIPGRKKSEEQIGRSVFYFAKWGALSCLLPRLLEEAGEGSAGDSKEVDDFFEDFSKIAFEAVQGVPVDAMVAFFHCVVVAGRRQLSTPGEEKSLAAGVIDTLLLLMEERMSSRDAALMLYEFCALIFQTGLMVQEFQGLKTNPRAEAPIRDAFRRLISMAGKSRPHISRAVLCHATVAWLGNGSDATVNSHGWGAIAYRQDIMDLLLHKEAKLDVVTANQSVRQKDIFERELHLPAGIDESSIARGYVLLFFSKLPAPEDLHPDVLKLLVHHIILGLLDKICLDTTAKGANKLIMLGSDEYVLKIRGWQALCCLSRFVTEEIVGTVCDRIFGAMGEALHQQIRYFLEIFALQTARKNPAVICKALLKDINRRDLSLQHMTSLMIVLGNLVLGQCRVQDLSTIPLKKVLAGVIPWLGSTQGFSRGIAQLLTHTLIPMVVDMKKSKISTVLIADGEDSNWFLMSIYNFLDQNQEMKRLRQKSSKFFNSYEVERICTPEGLLSIPVDEGGEAFPVHMVETMKQCLQEVYEETHELDLPQWKTMEDMLKNQVGHGEEGEQQNSSSEDNLANFQRKIIPIDELNLALESMKERRQRNIVGRKKQKLVVCASLIDKVPNLGGLARTSEIFAAEKLVIPDIGVTKMDNFKSLSVGAGDWIEIEECREENLLRFLQLYRARNYFIVGVEQTSSSVSLEGFRFPDQPILLLLGKEKEGIPIQFLEVVDQCVEIPQMGIIRSLNVHVSGALTIWEYSRQQILGKNRGSGKFEM